jgi:hypothetical protein
MIPKMSEKSSLTLHQELNFKWDKYNTQNVVLGKNEVRQDGY